MSIMRGILLTVNDIFIRKFVDYTLEWTINFHIAYGKKQQKKERNAIKF